jgi:hypothetical protein
MGEVFMSGKASTGSGSTAKGLNLMELIPDHFQRFFEFFKPGHTEGVVHAPIKELARLKIAAMNGCDT